MAKVSPDGNHQIGRFMAADARFKLARYRIEAPVENPHTDRASPLRAQNAIDRTEAFRGIHGFERCGPNKEVILLRPDEMDGFEFLARLRRREDAHETPVATRDERSLNIYTF
jgi:hypothetical protein